MTTFFMTPELRRSPALERIQFIPKHYSYIYRYLRAMPDLDMMIVQGAPGDNNGQCSYGLSSEHAPGALESAKTVVVEMNAQVPFTNCVPPLPLERIDYIVESMRAPRVSITRTHTKRACYWYACGFVSKRRGYLADRHWSFAKRCHAGSEGHKDLGFHSGLMSDDVLELVECGALTGARKNVDGIIVTGTIFGSSHCTLSLRIRVFKSAALHIPMKCRLSHLSTTSFLSTLVCRWICTAK